MAKIGGLTAKQQRFVVAMVSGACTTQEAATVAGLTRRTGERYNANPSVRAAIQAALDETLNEAMRKVVHGMGQAVDTLETLHQDKGVPPAVRVSAARAILAVGPTLRESTELADRVSALEECTGAKQTLMKKLGVSYE